MSPRQCYSMRTLCVFHRGEPDGGRRVGQRSGSGIYRLWCRVRTGPVQGARVNMMLAEVLLMCVLSRSRGSVGAAAGLRPQGGVARNLSAGSAVLREVSVRKRIFLSVPVFVCHAVFFLVQSSASRVLTNSRTARGGSGRTCCRGSNTNRPNVMTQ